MRMLSNKSNIVLLPIPKNKQQNTIETEEKNTIDEADDKHGDNNRSRSGNADSGNGGAENSTDNNGKEGNKESEN